MSTEFQQLLALSLQDPRQAARHVLLRPVPAQTLWLGFALAVTASAVLAWLMLQLSPSEMRHPMIPADTAPLKIALAQALSLLALTAGVAFGGRLFGGAGTFVVALRLIVWIQIVLLALQLAQLAAMLVSPLLSALFGLFGMGLFLWMLAAFTAELHGFKDRLLVFGGIIAGFFLMGVLLLILVGPPIPVAGA